MYLVEQLAARDPLSGTEAAAFPLPDSTVFAAAQNVNFDELLGDLSRTEKAVAACSKKVDKVISTTSDEALVQPFKDTMETLLVNCHADVTELKKGATEAQHDFEQLVNWFRFQPKGGTASSVPPADFFAIWTTFAAHALEYWTVHQRTLQRKQFEAARLAKQQQAQAISVRKATDKGLKSKLKKRFGRRASSVDATAADQTTPDGATSDRATPDRATPDRATPETQVSAQDIAVDGTSPPQLGVVPDAGQG